MNKLRDALEKCFFDYRAENLYNVFGDIFVKPPFFDDLAGVSPCFLIGGRGTGKTTALKSLRFDAKLPNAAQHLGIYIRINKNQVHCFQSDLYASLLRRAFSHYFNLLVAQEVIRLLRWISRDQQSVIAAIDVASVCRSLGLRNADSLLDFRAAVAGAIQDLELFVNNIDARHDDPPVFSPPESPVKAMAQLVCQFDGLGRPLLCCIDEYENLLPYQQAALNTYIKHSEVPLSYKVGMKAGGLVTSDTLTEGDPLRTPADYREIDIASLLDASFFEEILSRRMAFARRAGVGIPEEIGEFLVPLDRLDEAEKLGATRVATAVRDELASNAEVGTWVGKIRDGDVILLRYRSEVEGAPLLAVVRRLMNDDDAWRNVKNNHGFSSLFWLSRGRKGARRRKYYCGLTTILMVANGNVRFFLEFIGDSVRNALPEELSDRIVISPEQQTDAARAVATRQLEQLDSLGRHGGELKRLVLGIGKLFFELTRRPEGRTPEPTSFVLTGNVKDIGAIRTRLRRGIANLVFVSNARTKATSDVEIRDDEYSLHPVLAPFFEMSYRKKRRITVNAGHLRMLQTDSKRAMAQLLSNVKRTRPGDLPVQLSMFSSLYEEIDITSLPMSAWAPLVRVALLADRELWIVYAEPRTYEAHKMPTPPELFDLSERVGDVEGLPGMARLAGPSPGTPLLLVVLLGFEGGRARHISTTVDPEPKIVPVIGAPGMHPEYATQAVECNREFLTNTDAFGLIRWVDAVCPFSVRDLLGDIASEHSGSYMYLAPIGTKPHALGALLYSLSCSGACEIIYDDPLARKGGTSGIGKTYVYRVN